MSTNKKDIITNNILLPMENKDCFLDIDGVPIHLKLEVPETAEASIPMMILCHGFTGCMEEDLLLGVRDEAVKHGMACLRIELYGHGESGGEFCDHDIQKWADEMIYIVDYANTLPWVNKLILCGHSQGGMTTALCSKKRGHLLSALIPISPAYFIPEQSRAGCNFDLDYDPDNIPEVLELFERKLKANYFKVAQGISTEEAIAAYKGPVRMVHGVIDESVPIQISRNASLLYGDCKLYEIEDDDHCFTHHLPDALVAIDEILNELLG